MHAMHGEETRLIDCIVRVLVLLALRCSDASEQRRLVTWVYLCRYVHAGLLYASLSARALAAHVACVEVRRLTEAWLVFLFTHD